MPSSWPQAGLTWVVRRSWRWVSVDDVVKKKHSTLNTCTYNVDVYVAGAGNLVVYGSNLKSRY